MLQEGALESFQQRLGYQFKQPDLLQQALTHRSAKGDHNERLEFLGDSILGFVTAANLYQTFPKADEGQLTRLRAQLVKEKTLADLAKELDIGPILSLGGGELKSGGFRRASILSDAFEAVLGAIYLDSDIDSVSRVIEGLYQSRYAELTLDKADKDPKTQLQEWLQSRKHPLPDYEVIRMEGKEHNRTYWVSCSVTAFDLQSEGVGSSRRKAEKAAASLMLEKIYER
ncbi:MAG: ribonuclease III [Kangiellaceae bacterium]|nr:ribonuclease III [Kangiellaceae bacterium]